MPARLTGWMLVLVLVAVIAWLFVRHVDRLAIAADRWMLAWDRRAARKAVLAAKALKERELALTVPDQLQRETPAERPRSGYCCWAWRRTWSLPWMTIWSP
jgi:hypothetical protein